MSILDLEQKVKETLSQKINERAKMYYGTLFDIKYDLNIDAIIKALAKLLHDINVATTPLHTLYENAYSLGIDARYNVAVVNVVLKTGNMGELDAINRVTGLSKRITVPMLKLPLRKLGENLFGSEEAIPQPLSVAEPTERKKIKLKRKSSLNTHVNLQIKT